VNVQKENKKVFHYTDHLGLTAILNDGAIRPAADLETGWPPVTWLSENSLWEPICRPALDLGIGEQDYATVLLDPCGYKCPVARIQVRRKITSEWPEILNKYGVDSMDIFRLVQIGYEYGSSPEDWRICIGEIDLRDWLAVEVWDGSKWVVLSESGFSGGSLAVVVTGRDECMGTRS